MPPTLAEGPQLPRQPLRAKLSGGRERLAGKLARRHPVAGDEHGFLFTGRDVPDRDLAGYDGDRPLFMETSLPGVWSR